MCKKHYINYDFENWKKLRTTTNGGVTEYIIFYIKNGKDELKKLLDETIFKRDLRKKMGRNGHGGETSWWIGLKNYCLKIGMKYDFEEWENRNNRYIKIKQEKFGLNTLNNIQKSYDENKRYIIFSKHSEERLPGGVLKRHLIYCGVEYKCFKCGISPSKPHPHGPHFSLQLLYFVEHIDGNPVNNTFIFDIVEQRKINPNIGKTNLCFLCPNCHQNETNRKKKEESERRHMKKEDVNILQISTSL